ncbi:MAG: restriction endonuclease [Kiritimatiellae bacterium]|nr:restriction endonuclease [Kiritimatiellia bacterium]
MNGDEAIGLIIGGGFVMLFLAFVFGFWVSCIFGFLLFYICPPPSESPARAIVVVIIALIGLKIKSDIAKEKEIAKRKAEEEKEALRQRNMVYYTRLNRLRKTPYSEYTKDDVEFLAEEKPTRDMKRVLFKKILAAGNMNAAGLYLDSIEPFDWRDNPEPLIAQCDEVNAICESARMYYLKGKALERIRRRAEAVAAYKRAMEVDRATTVNEAKLKDYELEGVAKDIRRLEKALARESIERDGNYTLVKTGLDYENFVLGAIRRAGYECENTPTNDQGVDLVATLKNGWRLAVQCKFLGQHVSNSAVQEVVAGMRLYRCKFACVVSKSGYTKSAEKLAEANQVGLLHHGEIADYMARLDERRA